MVSALKTIGSDKALQEHWFQRIIAIIIDSVILSVVGMLLTWFVMLPYVWTPPAQLVWPVIWPGMSGVMLFIYSLIMESSAGGATLGKRVMSLRVIPISGKADAGKIAVRNISKIYGALMLIDLLVGFTTDGDPKQRWLDRVAGTTVVTTKAITDQEQHLYQSQQAKYAPPPQEPYAPTRHESSYQYPPKKEDSQQPKPKAPVPEETKCASCGGRMSETGGGRLKCIRCGRVQ